mmetsp:Transcript_32083/g.73813  ORF Transcript_32083/g.73813 Transcript_32083/m.73813 type:complete len:80 (-) Transcript_32083:354-593(-)
MKCPVLCCACYHFEFFPIRHHKNKVTEKYGIFFQEKDLLQLCIIDLTSLASCFLERTVCITYFTMHKRRISIQERITTP